jgi:hypothetical protein
MSETINYELPVEGTVPVTIMITSQGAYFTARAEADKIAKKNGLVIATMPQLIAELQHLVPRNAIRQSWADVDSPEYNGRVDFNNVYAVGHRFGPFSTTTGLKQGAKNIKEYGFMLFSAKKWTALVNDKNMFPLGEIKGNKTFSCDAPYGIIANVKDMIFYDRGQLKAEQFMKSDRVLMVAGSEDSREKIANTLFNVEKRSTVGDYHRLKEVDFSTPNGRPVCLGDINGFVGHYYSIFDNGRFVLVAPEAHSVPAKQVARDTTIISPSLDQIMKISSQYIAPANIDVFKEELSTLYPK